MATHLASAASRRGSDVVLIDADPAYGDIGVALGAPNEEVHTIADLLPLTAELTVAHVTEALWSCEEGFRVLLAPTPDQGVWAEARDLSAIVRVAASCCDAVVLHLPRTLDDASRAAIEGSDRVLEVLSLDVLSFRATSRALDTLRAVGSNGRLGFVVNRAARSEITAADVARVFGAEPLAVVPRDGAVERAQNNGRLLPARGRIARTFDRLAARVFVDEAGAQTSGGESE